MSAPDPKCFDTPTNVGQWYEENKELFSPPICNKLMHRSQLQVMFVGGPNKRRDFHLDRGSEFFYQMRGNMKLPIILPFNKLRIVEIKEGEVFLLPSCVPHSPQRPEEGSLGLVVERERAKSEPDGLRYFEGFDFILNEDDPSKLDVDKILWERFFHCASLANDLLPVVKAYAASEEAQTNKAVDNVFSWGPPDEDGNVDRSLEPKFPVNKKIQDVPAPFNLKNWLAARRERLAAGEVIPLFNDSDDHPDKEFRVDVLGGAEKREFKGPEVEGIETFLFVVEGAAVVEGGGGGKVDMVESDCLVLKAGETFTVAGVDAQAILMLTQCRPNRNAETYGYVGFQGA